jgi:hypothetical protein
LRDGVVAVTITRAELYALARDHSRPVETRRAAEDALDALGRVAVRLHLDAGRATGEVPDHDGGARRTWRST